MDVKLHGNCLPLWSTSILLLRGLTFLMQYIKDNIVPIASGAHALCPVSINLEKKAKRIFQFILLPKHIIITLPCSSLNMKPFKGLNKSALILVYELFLVEYNKETPLAMVCATQLLHSLLRRLKEDHFHIN